MPVIVQEYAIIIPAIDRILLAENRIHIRAIHFRSRRYRIIRNAAPYARLQTRPILRDDRISLIDEDAQRRRKSARARARHQVADMHGCADEDILVDGIRMRQIGHGFFKLGEIPIAFKSIDADDARRIDEPVEVIPEAKCGKALRSGYYWKHGIYAEPIQNGRAGDAQICGFDRHDLVAEEGLRVYHGGLFYHWMDYSTWDKTAHHGCRKEGHRVMVHNKIWHEDFVVMSKMLG